MRVIRDRARKAEFRPTRCAVKNAPITAHRPLKRAFPRLVERLNDVDPKILALRQRQRLGNRAYLVRPRGPRALPHPAGARPTELADDDLLPRHGGSDPLADGG